MPSGRLLNRHLKTCKELQHSRDLYRLLFEGMTNGSALYEVLLDEAGAPTDCRFLEVNPAFERITGLTREEVVGRTVREVLPGTDAEWIETFGRAAAAGEPVLFERYHAGLDKVLAGSVFSLEPGRFAVTFTDETDRQRAEERLRRQTAVLENVLAHVPNHIFWKDRDGRYLGCNEHFAADAGVAGPGAIRGKSDFDLPWRQEEAEFFRRCDRQVMDTGTPMLEIEEPLRRADGREVILLTSKVPLRDAAGDVTGVLGIFTDITERVALEARLRAVQRLESLGRLAGGVAHDFNNLLTVILGQGELLLMRLQAGDPFRAGLEDILAAGERARELTRQLLAFGRKQVLKPRVLDLNRVVSDIEGVLRRIIGEDVLLTARLDPHLGRVKADPAQLEQVIVNLAVNARDAMPRGGKLTVETANVFLDEAYAREHADVRPGPHVLLAVSDNGCGMTEETLSHVFEPFFTTKEDGKGTGLGLATVYGIVRQSGGHLWVHSEPGGGATFKVYLPRTEEAPTPRAEEIGAGAPPGGDETVLLVEDDGAARALVCQFLAKLGYTVLEAESPAVALRRSCEHPGPIHLLLSDVVMPGMGGPDLAECLAAERPGLKVLYISGYSDDAIVHHGVLAPGVPLLPKPVPQRELARKVREVLGVPRGPQASVRPMPPGRADRARGVPPPELPGPGGALPEGTETREP